MYTERDVWMYMHVFACLFYLCYMCSYIRAHVDAHAYFYVYVHIICTCFSYVYLHINTDMRSVLCCPKEWLRD